MKYIFLLLLVSLFLLLNNPANAAFIIKNNVEKEQRTLNDYLIRHWETRDGLPHNSVNEIIQDNKGYLWLATWQGPTRFNGRRFDIYDNLRETGLPDVGMYTMVYSHCDGSIYVAGNRGGIARFYDGRWRTLQSAPPFVNHLSIDKNCNLWVSTSELGLLAYKNNQRSAQFTTQHGLESMFVYESLVDNDGNLWAATNKGLQVKKAGQPQFVRVPTVPENIVTSLFELENNSLLVGTEKGLYNQANGIEFEPFHSEVKSRISTIFQTDNNQIWLGTYRDGLIRISELGTEVFNVSQGLPNNHVLDITQDKEGSFWVATHGGLVQFRDALFSTYKLNDGLSGNYIRAIAENSNGDTIVGSSNGLSVISGSEVSSLAADTRLKNESVLSLAYNNQQELYIGTYTNGLYLWDGEKIIRHFTTDDLLTSNEIRQIALSPGIGVFLASPAGITHLYKNAKKEWVSRQLSEKDGLPNNFTMAVHLDEQRQLWAGSAGGLIKIKVTAHNDSFSYQVTPVDLTSLNNAQLAFHITERSGYIWMATDRGLIAHNIDNNSWQIFNRDQGLPFDNFMSVAFDGDANIWLGSSRGPVMIEHDSMTQVLMGQADTLNFQRLTDFKVRKLIPADRRCLKLLTVASGWQRAKEFQWLIQKLSLKLAIFLPMSI